MMPRKSPPRRPTTPKRPNALKRPARKIGADDLEALDPALKRQRVDLSRPIYLRLAMSLDPGIQVQ